MALTGFRRLTFHQTKTITGMRAISRAPPNGNSGTPVLTATVPSTVGLTGRLYCGDGGPSP